MRAILDEHEKNGTPGYSVAVKMPKQQSSAEQIEELKLEGAIMAQFSHPNVVGLIGQVNEQGIFVLIVQYCEYGSLLSWLRGPNGTDVRVDTLMAMALDVASGMTYLANIGIVHRDLAARNVLVASDLTCKIADFGFAKHTSSGKVMSEGMQRVPIRWTAPEVVETHSHTTKSDVWSYGVLLYELFTHGMEPYGTWSPHKVIKKLREGYRLPSPEACPAGVYDLMLRSWEIDPSRRIDFAQIRGCMNDIAVRLKTERHVLFITNDESNHILNRFIELQEHDREAHRKKETWQRTSSGPYQMLQSSVPAQSTLANKATLELDIQANASNSDNDDREEEVGHLGSGWLFAFPSAPELIHLQLRAPR
jgi:serine/threonine protein kinase